MTDRAAPHDDDPQLGIAGIDRVLKIGAGASATVYRAWQPMFERMVAVKVFRPAANERAERMIEREFAVMGRLSGQTDAVAVFAGGRTDAGLRYLLMPYFGRGSLHDLIGERGPLPWREAVYLLLPVADTVADLHSVGIVHRDIKPANILLSDHGRPRLADFGISVELGTGTTVQGTVAFTASYGAPETFDELVLDTSVDVYSLGATLWALLAGASPFVVDGGSNRVEEIVERARLGDSASLGDSTPDPIEALIDLAMSANPARRPPSARHFAEQLRRAVREVNVAEALHERDVAVTSAAESIDPVHDKAGPRIDRPMLVIIGLLCTGALLLLFALLA